MSSDISSQNKLLDHLNKKKKKLSKTQSPLDEPPPGLHKKLPHLFAVDHKNKFTVFTRGNLATSAFSRKLLVKWQIVIFTLSLNELRVYV